MGVFNMERWAVYYAPPTDSLLWEIGCRWIGRDAESGYLHGAPPGIAAELWKSVVTTPSTYGLHATLKPPMTLAQGKDSPAFLHAVEQLAQATPQFSAPPLALSWLADFLVLKPERDCPQLSALAASCVKDLDQFRKPQTREIPETATARQKMLNRRWGYPFVLDEFRFHITLTSGLGAEQRAVVEPAVKEFFKPVLTDEPLPIHEICVFHQPGEAQAFELKARFPLRR